jgi:hypothetical protein
VGGEVVVGKSGGWGRGGGGWKRRFRFGLGRVESMDGVFGIV